MSHSVITNTRKSLSWVKITGVSSLLFICLFVLCSSQLMAQGNLLISPTRIVFEGQTRIGELSLANTGQDSAKYSISFVQYRMKEDGNYEEITAPDPGQNFADKNIRVFPRSVMLGPNESQVIKLQLIKTEQLEPGEYRSHIYFRAIPNQKALGEDAVKKDTSNISIKIVSVFGVTLPVIIRVGASTTTLNITDLKVEKATAGSKKLHLTIQRTGNMSVYGDITVTYIASNGKETNIGEVNGLAIYTPNLLRKVQVDLEDKSSVDLSKGTIHVLYSTQKDSHAVKLAEADLKL